MELRSRYHYALREHLGGHPLFLDPVLARVQSNQNFVPDRCAVRQLHADVHEKPHVGAEAAQSDEQDQLQDNRLFDDHQEDQEILVDHLG